MADSVRERIVQQMVVVFTAMDGVDTKFARVFEEDWVDRRNEAKNVLSISEGLESYVENQSSDKLDRNLEVELRASINVARAVSPSSAIRAVLADLEHVAMANVTWGGNAIGTVLVSNLRTVEDTADRQVGLSVALRVLYRTRRTDPTLF